MSEESDALVSNDAEALTAARSSLPILPHEKHGTEGST
jgi:hypothetical protein